MSKSSFFANRFPILKPLINAVDSFLFESERVTQQGPHIRDAIDLKRWMILVVAALLPCVFVAIWNSGVQSFVYSSGNSELMKAYIEASSSLNGYLKFTGVHWLSILQGGLISFLPLVFISYAVGGFWEALFAVVRKHEIAEGFLVSGLLYPLILPPTIPYWMAAIGISVGIILSKELFGGTGMNILNPALTCRCFLYFAFPASMTGEVWAGRNTTVIRESLFKMNEQAGLSQIDGYSQQSALAIFQMGGDGVKRIHVDAISANQWQEPSSLTPFIDGQLQQFSQGAHIETLTKPELQQFLSATLEQGGLALSPDSFQAALKFAELKQGVGLCSDWNLFLGNKLGSFGEVSILACLIGAFLLLYIGLASWRTMMAVAIGAFLTAFAFEYSSYFGSHLGAWNAAALSLPAYKHFLMGGLVFGLVFMATDPVSGPSMNSAKWVYGLLIGMLTIIIRTINPAYPEGVMLAILFGNVFAPLLDHYAVRLSRRRRRVLS
jgi:Na+-transporting NADH:ubiquinone oxidoreductase subunit B